MNPIIPQDSINPQDVEDYLTRSHAAAKAGWTRSEKVVEDQTRDDQGESLSRGYSYVAPIVDNPFTVFSKGKQQSGG